MPKKYVPVLAAGVTAAIVAVGIVVLRRTRGDLPPVSPTVPRVEDLPTAADPVVDAERTTTGPADVEAS